MSELDEEIARIAALRGRPVTDFTERPKPKGVAVEQLERLLRPSPASKSEQFLLDDLPGASRALIANWECMLNVYVWNSLLDVHDEDYLIKAFTGWYAKRTGRGGMSPVRKVRRRLS